jgi:NTP pyrophosphatase (non-canonical NTP hydrolase)
MTPEQYIRDACRTNSPYFFPTDLASSHKDIDILHAALGIATEAGELLDPFKKAMFYGKSIDLVNIDEEVGDILWYVAIYLNARGLTFEQVMQQNIDKLRTRYPEKFTSEQAINRDLDAERETLEQGSASDRGINVDE